MKKKNLSDLLIKYFLIIFLVIFFWLSLVLNFSLTGEQQFSYLAKAFLQGKFYFLEFPGTWGDAVSFNGQYYWHMGPFPSVFLLPLVFFFDLFGKFFYQGYVQFFLTLGIFFMCFKLARKFGYLRRDALFLAFAFCFASVYQIVALIPWGWFFSQALTVFFLFLSIWEYLGKRRWVLIGIYLSFVFATRFTAGLGILFFIADILTKKRMNLSKKIFSLGKLCLPMLFVGILLLFYNFARFGNFFKSGYEDANSALVPREDSFELYNYGLFKIKNIPTNLYYYFVKTLDPILVEKKSVYVGGEYLNTYILKPPFVEVNFPGTSFFIASPIFLYLLRVNLKKRIVKLSLIPICLILFMLMTYYWPGWRQVGPRYLLDLLPFAYLLLIFSFRGFKLSVFAKVIIFLSSLFDLYLLTTVF